MYWVAISACALQVATMACYATAIYVSLSDAAAVGIRPEPLQFVQAAVVIGLQLLSCFALLNRDPRRWWIAIFAVLFQIEGAISQVRVLSELSDWYLDGLTQPFEWTKWIGEAWYYLLLPTTSMILAPTLAVCALASKRALRTSAE